MRAKYRKVLSFLFVSAFAIMAEGCAGSKLSKLDDRSQDDWQVCYKVILKKQCGYTPEEAAAQGSTITLLTCSNDLVDRYVATRKSKRKKWLLRHGCPPYMVND